jgi:hypothetical protein
MNPIVEIKVPVRANTKIKYPKVSGLDSAINERTRRISVSTSQRRV